MKNIMIISSILPCNNYSGGVVDEQVVNYLLAYDYKYIKKKFVNMSNGGK